MRNSKDIAAQLLKNMSHLNTKWLTLLSYGIYDYTAVLANASLKTAHWVKVTLPIKATVIIISQRAGRRKGQ
ncbi:hypothetical protein MHN79_03220 [Vibrio sp. Of14-4]|uniref:hypothetical protein n=1 Tax=Vibrio sp. Of14-4 TaxID=2724878 RepID=UPI001EF34C10|nr:hypothetical protein [Vibrio sp. Of14-4]MCG7488492.1 hypothetical protein [Vibrio sp. Of14-4]